MAKRKSARRGSDRDALQEALLSVGADRYSTDRLVSSKVLGDIVIPMYWKDGLVSSVRPLSLIRLPQFLRSFREEFPDGQVRWDDDYEGADPTSGDIALHVFFNYQEDDQGDHWSPPPTLLEEESYYRMLSAGSYDGRKAIPVSKAIR